MPGNILLFLKLAWRNVFRNKRRTVITAISIGIGLTSLIFTDALMLGMHKNMVKSITSTFIGEGQIHRKDFLETLDIDEVILNKDEVISDLQRDNDVEFFTQRTTSFATISSAADVQAVNMIGVNPLQEKDISLFNRSIIKGSFFNDKLLWINFYTDPKRFKATLIKIFKKYLLNDNDLQQDIVIGYNIAEELDVGIGSRVVVTVSQADGGGLSQEMFKVSGIFKFNIKELDSRIVLIEIGKSQNILNLSDDIHEIALKFNDINYSNDTTALFFSRYSRYGNKAISWVQIMPQVQSAFKLTKISILIVMFIIFFLVAFGIINTLFMSIFERIYEFGVLRAVGTRRRDLVKLVMFETGSLALFSIFVGILLSLITCFILSKTGINYSGIEYQGVMLNVIYPVNNLYQYMVYPLLLFIFTLLIGIYPSIYVAKISPAHAMRKTI